ncbi:MAG: adenosine deaminase [Chloroflexi bacterium]|nr:MAG: adenosine deaminase [Chloroflexota bacterium]
MPHPLGDELTELHVHLGGAVDPAAMWGIAHDQGIRLPTKDYWEFVDLITVRKQSKKSFEDFLALYHWTELIQSSPLAVEQSVYEVVGGAYRKANITTLELRYNPMKRNRGGERDLDHIINASIRGLDRALLDYPVKAGLIFCLDRTFEETLNAILVEKAIAYKHRGIVGIDIAGGKNPDFRYRDYSALFKKARKAGLGITVHAGEDEDWESVDEVLQHLEPDRIGHGIHAARNAALCRRLAERGVLLEICPSSNLDSKVVKDADELGEYIAVFKKHKVRFSFNTDGPEMLETTLRDELRLAVRSGWVTKEELAECGAWAKEASFLSMPGTVRS